MTAVDTIANGQTIALKFTIQGGAPSSGEIKGRIDKPQNAAKTWDLVSFKENNGLYSISVRSLYEQPLHRLQENIAAELSALRVKTAFTTADVAAEPKTLAETVTTAAKRTFNAALIILGLVLAIQYAPTIQRLFKGGKK